MTKFKASTFLKPLAGTVKVVAGVFTDVTFQCSESYVGFREKLTLPHKKV